MTDITDELADGFDTIGGDIVAPSSAFKDFLKGIPRTSQVFTYSNNETISTSIVEEGHRLIVQGLEIEYVYELEPRQIDGIWHFQYGISATKNKTAVEGFILHHTSDSPFDNYLQYMSRHDSKRGGTFGYHFLIGQGGRVAQTAPLSKRTNHVQSASYRTSALSLTNKNTLSISLHSGYKILEKKYLPLPASEVQLDTAKLILRALVNEFNVSREAIWGHGEIQSDRMHEEALVLAKWSRENIGIA
ncbi:MAG: N-acetylmuramoyl-L-alanine amidase [Bacteroidetes bacterium]|nr:N-acetylmuramoyl-L-alanine amidase [Bacteroidota bacterium]